MPNARATASHSCEAMAQSKECNSSQAANPRILFFNSLKKEGEKSKDSTSSKKVIIIEVIDPRDAFFFLFLFLLLGYKLRIFLQM